MIGCFFGEKQITVPLDPHGLGGDLHCAVYTVVHMRKSVKIEHARNVIKCFPLCGAWTTVCCPYLGVGMEGFIGFLLGHRRRGT